MNCTELNNLVNNIIVATSLHLFISIFSTMAGIFVKINISRGVSNTFKIARAQAMKMFLSRKD